MDHDLALVLIATVNAVAGVVIAYLRYRAYIPPPKQVAKDTQNESEVRAGNS